MKNEAFLAFLLHLSTEGGTPRAGTTPKQGQQPTKFAKSVANSVANFDELNWHSRTERL